MFWNFHCARVTEFGSKIKGTLGEWMVIYRVWTPGVACFPYAVCKNDTDHPNITQSTIPNMENNKTI